jgi:hypothetical protein
MAMISPILNWFLSHEETPPLLSLHAKVGGRCPVAYHNLRLGFKDFACYLSKVKRNHVEVAGRSWPKCFSKVRRLQ